MLFTSHLSCLCCQLLHSLWNVGISKPVCGVLLVGMHHDACGGNAQADTAECTGWVGGWLWHVFQSAHGFTKSCWCVTNSAQKTAREHGSSCEVAHAP
jgi:hypothetical protein